MAKKGLIIDEGRNLGGLRNLIPEAETQKEEISETKNEEKPQEADKPWKIRTFMVYDEDYEFINQYVLYMGFTKKKKYTQKEALSDAIRLLKEKHPDIE